MRNLSSLALLVAAWETFIQTSSHSWYTLWRALLGYNHKIRVKLSNARLQSLQRSEKSALKWKSKTKCARRRERKKKWKPTMNTKQIWEWRRLRGFKKYGTNIYKYVCVYVCMEVQQFMRASVRVATCNTNLYNVCHACSYMPKPGKRRLLLWLWLQLRRRRRRRLRLRCQR